VAFLLIYPINLYQVEAFEQPGHRSLRNTCAHRKTAQFGFQQHARQSS